LFNTPFSKRPFMRYFIIPTLVLLAAGAHSAELVRGLGGDTGFGEGFLFRNDDESLEVDLSPVFPTGLKYYGTVYNTVWLNNNGNLTFGHSLYSFTPSAITGNIGIPIIAAWYADVDTRADAPSGDPTWDGYPRTNGVYYDLDAVRGAFTATWDYVGYYSRHLDKRCAFQIRLVRVGSGQEFDIEFRYKRMEWTTGDASGGSGGLGGTVVRAGYSASNGINYFELPQSGIQSSMLALNTTAGNTGVMGIWTWEVRRPVIDITPASGFSNATVIPFTFSVTTDSTGFDASDITVTGGTAGALSGPVLSGTRSIYTLPVTVPEGTVQVSVPANIITSSFGDQNLASSATVIVDRTAPVAPGVPVVGPGVRPELSGTGEAYATITIYAGGVRVGSVVANDLGNWVWQSAGMSSGTKVITVTSTDQAGNTSAASASTTMTYTAPPVAASSSGDSGGCGGGLSGLLIAAGLMLGLRRRR
jgi:hypothetical protein